jgi:hypothetical protein
MHVIDRWGEATWLAKGLQDYQTMEPNLNRVQTVGMNQNLVQTCWPRVDGRHGSRPAAGAGHILGGLQKLKVQRLPLTGTAAGSLRKNEWGADASGAATDATSTAFAAGRSEILTFMSYR